MYAKLWHKHKVWNISDRSYKKIPTLFSHLFMISLHYSVTNIFGILMTLLCAREPEWDGALLQQESGILIRCFFLKIASEYEINLNQTKSYLAWNTS